MADGVRPQRIWLIGLMGCGKSTVGRALALSLDCRYVDNDLTIHELAGRSTVDLAAGGNGLLHQWESRYVRHVSALPTPVVAGIPASAADRPADLRTLTATGLLVYLQCDLDTLVNRIEADEPRPWVQQNVRTLITGMLTERDPALLATAGLTLDGTAPVTTSVTRITDALQGSECPAPADPSLRHVAADHALDETLEVGGEFFGGR